VWIGGYLSDLPADNLDIYLASLAVALVCGAGNAFNDFVDVESDRINHPDRPLPSGKLKLYTAVLASFLMALFSLIPAAFAGLDILVVILILHIVLFLYSALLKKIILVGNLTVAVAGAAPFFIGGLTAGKAAVTAVPGIWIPGLFAFVFHFGRELVKDINDLDGDNMGRTKTLPAVINPQNSLIVTTIVMAVLIGLTLLPLYFHWYRQFYALTALLLVDLPLVIVLIYMWISKDERRFRFAGSIFKLLMLFGLIAFVGGKI